MMIRATGLIFCLIIFVAGLAAAEEPAAAWETPEYEEEDVRQSVEGEEIDSLSPFALSLKLGWHWFWRMGVLKTASMHPVYGVGVGDMQGFTGEVDFDWFFRDWLVFTATAGGYCARLSQYDQNYMTGYGLLSAKLQRTGPYADYYVGTGLGLYLSRVSNPVDSAIALQPGIHALAGIRIHVTDHWSVLLEDRVAFTLRATGLFKNMDLGGNFLYLGTSYRF